MISALIWVAILAVGVGFEAWSLRRDADEWQPLTYWVRRVMRYSLLFRAIVLVFCVWLTLHFGFGVT